jgi:hypothetical protein
MIFLDMDGVLCNFVEASLIAHNRPEKHDDVTTWEYFKSWGISDKEFWDKCSGVEFWANLKEYPWAGQLVATSQMLAEHYFLTAPTSTKRPECIAGKEAWLMGDSLRMIPTEFKHLIAAPGRVLVDDSAKNIENWIEHGGIGLGLKQPWNKFTLDGWGVIEKLKELF